MRLALIGRDIAHSCSPDLYRELISPAPKYDLLDIKSADQLPSLSDLSKSYDAINITSPYKEHYVSQVTIDDASVRALGAINTVCLKKPFSATNTDLIAVREMLKDFKTQYSDLHIMLLGSGVMARLTELVASELNLPLQRKARILGDDMQRLTLVQKEPGQLLVINACSRQYFFEGELPLDSIFWDYNYNFLPHQKSLPLRVKTYLDGLTLLRLQAESAIAFWSNNNP